MAKKGVLGNDPFLRGAAARPPKPAAPVEEAPPSESAAPRQQSAPAEQPAAKRPAAPKTKTRKAKGSRPPARPVEPQRSEAAAGGPVQAVPPGAPAQEPAAPALRQPEARGSVERTALPHPRADEQVAARIRTSKPIVQPELEESAAPERAPAPPLVDRALTSATFLRTVLAQAISSETLHRARQLLETAVRAIIQSVGSLSNPILDPYGKDPQLLGRLEPLLRFLYEDYWRIETADAARIPAGASILVANHSGAIPFDGPMLQRAILTERPELAEPRWLIEDQIFDAPLAGLAFNRLGAVRASPENALRLLEEGRPVLVFPEGIHGMGKPFAERYQLKRFGRGGFVKLALRTGAPIVPVAIIGAEEAAPLVGKLPPGMFGLDYVPITPLGPIPLPSKWMIQFGEPIRPEGSPDDAQAIERYTLRTREAIDQMLQGLLRKRRTIFAG